MRYRQQDEQHFGRKELTDLQDRMEASKEGEQKQTMFGTVMLFIKIFISRFASSGSLRRCVLSLIHIAQACSISTPVMTRIPPSMQGLWSWAVNFIKTITWWVNSVEITDELILIWSTITISVYLFALVFSLHIGMRMTLTTLLVLLCVVPLCISIGIVSGGGTWIPSVCFAVFDVGILWTAWIQSRGSEVPDCNFMVRWINQLGAQCNNVFYHIETFCSYGEDGIRRPEKKTVTVPSLLLIAGAWISFTMISFSYNGWGVYLFIFFGIIVLSLLVIGIFALLRMSMNDIRSLVDAIYYFYMDIIYSSVIDQLGAYFVHCEHKSWNLIIYAILFCVLLPLFYKILFTFQAARISGTFKKNKREYFRVIDNSSAGYASLCSGMKHNCYWWPAVETAIRIGYSIASVTESKIAVLIISSLLIVGIIAVRPYRYWSGFVIGLGEAAVILMMNIIGIASSEKLSIGVIIVVFAVSVTPVLGSIVLFTILELPHAYVATLMSVHNNEIIAKKYGKIASLRMALGLDPSSELKSTDDIPVFMKEDKFILSYPDQDVKEKIMKLKQEEKERADQIDPTVQVSKEDMVRFYKALGTNPEVFDTSVSDYDLEKDVLVERVEYEAAVLLRRLQGYQFPLAVLLATSCMDRWFKGMSEMRFESLIFGPL